MKPIQYKGFALVSTLSIVALLAMIAIALLSLSAISQRNSSSSKYQDAARENARLGLSLALSDLQTAVGQDQRITATAALLANDPAKAPQPGSARWLGVWDSSAYNPSTPNAKPFVRWMVSSNNHAALNSDAAANTLNLVDKVDILEAWDANGAPDPLNTVSVDKVPTQGNGAYAYWVEDESAKADLSWEEGGFTTIERKQNARLTSSPGADYSIFTGVNSPLVAPTYPINTGGTDPYLSNLKKASSTSDLVLAAGKITGDYSNWLNSVSQDVTLISRGVMSDVKKGGLRRDLSLAFEMDGTADVSATQQPALFNLQQGEFVGSGNAGDPLSAPSTTDKGGQVGRPGGLPVYERFLWRDFNGAGNYFSNDIYRSSDNTRGVRPTMRGPNWWALRDYYNLYKRLTGSAGSSYDFPARAYYPNRSSEGGLAYSDLHDVHGQGQTWDQESTYNRRSDAFGSSTGIDAEGWHYAYRPARANYAPVSLGYSALIGIKGVNPVGVAPNQTVDIACTVDPFFYFWNPYNRKMVFDNIAVVLGNGISGRIAFDIIDSNGDKTSYDRPVHSILQYSLESRASGNIASGKYVYLLQGPITMQPGEVVIAFTTSTGSDGDLQLGYEGLDNDSGLTLDKIITEEVPNPNRPNKMITVGSKLTVPVDSRIAFSFLQSKNDTNREGYSSGGETHANIHVSLPQGAGVSVASLTNDLQNLGEQTQCTHQVFWSDNEGLSTYVNDAGLYNSTYTLRETNQIMDRRPKVRTEPVSNLITELRPNKLIFGGTALLIKPASPGGGGTDDGDQINIRPSEMFSRFNPAPMLMKRDTYVRSYPNQMFFHATANSEFKVRDLMGIDYSGSSRGAFWGLSYQNTGSTSVPLCNIPSGPIMSLVDFSHANLSVTSTDPFRAVGNSWSCPLVSPVSPYGAVRPRTWKSTAQDYSWLINDALFDRYYLSGIAPDFTIGAGGYRASTTIKDSLDSLYGITGTNYASAKANPVMEPYLPANMTTADIVADLNPTDLQYANNPYDGYKKVGAYNLIKGAFNVNSTSVNAWAALLRANKGVDVNYADGGNDSDPTDTPFPSSSSPVAPNGSAEWAGLSRLTDVQIDGLAQSIVNQVMLRGPFMSISDFVNHKMGAIDNATSYTGAVQAALEIQAAASGVNSGAMAAAANNAAVDPNSANGTPSYDAAYIPFSGVAGLRNTTAGIPGDITQADILRPIAPRLTARADTFKIRAYGEKLSPRGDVIQAWCEATVQRIPEYIDADPVNGNDPWDDNDALTSARPLSAINGQLGRRLKVISFRWL